MQARFSVLFKSADAGITEPWDSPPRALGSTDVIKLQLSINHKCSALALSFFSLVSVARCPHVFYSLCCLCLWSLMHVCAPPPPPQHACTSLWPARQPRLVGLHACLAANRPILQPSPSIAFCMANNPYPEALSCRRGVSEQAILRLACWRKPLTWFILRGAKGERRCSLANLRGRSLGCVLF